MADDPVRVPAAAPAQPRVRGLLARLLPPPLTEEQARLLLAVRFPCC